MARIKNQYKRTGIYPYRYPVVQIPLHQQRRSSRVEKKSYFPVPIYKRQVSGSFAIGGDIKDKNYRGFVGEGFVSEVKIPYRLIALVILLAFFSVALNNGSNPMDMIFGNGAGEGGLANIVANMGTNIMNVIKKTSDIMSKFGMVNDVNIEGMNKLSQIWGTIKNYVGTMLSASIVLFNIFIQLLVFIFKILIYILTGGMMTI